MKRILKENRIPILNLCVGVVAGILAFRTGAANLPISIAIAFGAAAFLNMASLGVR